MERNNNIYRRGAENLLRMRESIDSMTLFNVDRFFDNPLDDDGISYFLVIACDNVSTFAICSVNRAFSTLILNKSISGSDDALAAVSFRISSLRLVCACNAASSFITEPILSNVFFV